MSFPLLPKLAEVAEYTNLILFMGKNGKKVFENSLKNWELEYTQKESLTNKDSFLLNIKKIKKKYKKN